MTLTPNKTMYETASTLPIIQALAAMKDYSTAKDIFFSYDGLFFHMDREGDAGKFRKHNVPNSMLDEWRLEIAQKYLSQIKSETSIPTGIEKLSYCFEPKSSISIIDEVLLELENSFSNYCTFGKIRAVESLMDLSEKNIGETYSAKVLLLCRKIISSIPISLTVSKHYWNISYLRDTLSKENLSKRIESIKRKIPQPVS